MIVYYRVLLPTSVYDGNLDENIKQYLERYPNYYFLREENGFAICNFLKGDTPNGRK